MSEPATIYHNPRCSKSRQTLALLQARGIEPVIVPYLDQPPDPATLKRLLAALGMRPRELMRSKEPPYQALGLADQALTDDELIQAMSENPILIERPIVVTAKGTVLGRPPENVLDVI